MVRVKMGRLQHILFEIFPRRQHRTSTVVVDRAAIRDQFLRLCARPICYDEKGLILVLGGFMLVSWILFFC